MKGDEARTEKEKKNVSHLTGHFPEQSTLSSRATWRPSSYLPAFIPLRACSKDHAAILNSHLPILRAILDISFAEFEFAMTRLYNRTNI